MNRNRSLTDSFVASEIKVAAIPQKKIIGTEKLAILIIP
jgi:hypothetical protein